MSRRASPHSMGGFTLVEMVMVIVITGILAALGGLFIAKPMESYFALDRRTALTDAADSALRLMAREIRSALPNSVRINPAGTSIEVIRTRDAARYRGSGTAGQVLSIGAPDTDFDLVGSFSQIAAVPAGARLAIYNLGVDPYNAYTAAGGAGTMTPAGTTITLSASTTPGEQHVKLSVAHTFPNPGSPRQRIFLVDGPITYACAGGTLTRYSNYGYAAAIAVPPAGTPTADTAAASTICTCDFTYTAGTATRSGLVTLSLALTDSGGETVTLLRQVRVDNAP